MVKGLSPKNNRRKILLILVDILCINLALVGGYFLFSLKYTRLAPVLLGSFWSSVWIFAPITTSIRLFFLFFFGIYDFRDRVPAYEALEKVFKAVTLSTIIIFVIIHSLRSYYFINIDLSRYMCFFEWGLNIIFLFGWRTFYFHLFPKFFSMGTNGGKESGRKDTLILGESAEGLHYFEEMGKIPYEHWDVLGYVASKDVTRCELRTLEPENATIYELKDQCSLRVANCGVTPAPACTPGLRNTKPVNRSPQNLKPIPRSPQNPQPAIRNPMKYMGDISNFLEIVNQYGINNVILASDEFLSGQIDELITQCDALGIRFLVLPGLYEMFAGKVKMQPIGAMPIFKLILEPIDGFQRSLKRLFDILFSLAAIFLFFPIMAAVALTVKLSSKGPVFFKQIRIGKNNRPFVIYKFRSMVDNAEQISGPVWAEDNDPRITPVGRFLRKTSLDEIPQLLLVLCGKLSIVGPRPERPHFVHKYKDFQGLRLRIKPGLTGLAQINGRYDATLADKIYRDIYYINNYSFSLDMIIVIKTIWAVLTAQGAR